MTSVRDPEWRHFPGLWARITSGTCLRHDGMSRNVGHKTVASSLAAHHLIAKSIKKLP
jgi:hypothetical protein